eukprot:gene1216-2367_t
MTRMAKNLCFLAVLSTICVSFQLSIKRSLSKKHYLSMQSLDTAILLFTPNCMRLHDNPALIFAERNKLSVLPVFVYDEEAWAGAEFKSTGLISAALDISNSLRDIGGELKYVRGDTMTILQDLHKGLNHGSKVIFCNSVLEPFSSVFDRLEKSLEAASIPHLAVTDSIFLDGPSSVLFKEVVSMYKPTDINRPVMNPSVSFISSDGTTSQTLIGTESDANNVGESYALRLIKDYIDVGDNAFTIQHVENYLGQSTSSQHRRSLARLAPEAANSMFQGEVLSATLSLLLAMGCVSPRLLLHARDVLPPLHSIPWRWRWDVPWDAAVFGCVLRQVAVRRDWHTRLAAAGTTRRSDEAVGDASSKSMSSKEWMISFRHWRGHIQREGCMTVDTHTDIDDNDNTSTSVAKPVLVLVHGFGGSLDQFTALASQLSASFDVFALDSLGFGQSEKPPLSYNQYLWRDQVVDFVRRIAHSSTGTRRKVVLAGNSIGGFTAGSAAAVLSGENLCDGLVLFNSAGKILKDQGLVSIPEDTLFPPYKGPAPFLLRLLGMAIFSLLQPRIVRTCEWLYPTNPGVVRLGLAASIYRDSCDPGASDVIASGGKLPSPTPFNDLFRQFLGPVLVAQGVLDPLNNSTARAAAFAGIRTDIDVDLLQLGHCPMDEGPEMVAGSILKWADKRNLLRRPDITKEEEIEVEVDSININDDSNNLSLTLQ